MKNDEILSKIKELLIAVPFQETIFSILEKNLHRIGFVKDHIGLRDFLFIAERESTYRDELFIALNVPVRKAYSLEENEEKMIQCYENRAYEVVASLQDFFKETERTLYVGIGFSNTAPTDEEYMSIEFSHQTGLIESKLQAHRELRMQKFPLWYRENSMLPEEINHLITEVPLPEEIEEKKHQLMKKINLALESGDEAVFLSLSKEYNQL